MKIKSTLVGVIIRQKFLLKVSKIISPVAVFIKRNYLALVPGYLNRWFWRDLDSKFGVFWAVSGI